jgi:hypothetical protein
MLLVITATSTLLARTTPSGCSSSRSTPTSLCITRTDRAGDPPRPVSGENARAFWGALQCGEFITTLPSPAGK